MSQDPARALRNPAPRRIAFASGRSVVLEDVHERISVTDPNGRFEIGIRFTAAGPVLDVTAIGINLVADAGVNIACDRFHVHARDRITFESGGDLIERVIGDRRTEVTGDARTLAKNVVVEAADGDLDLLATDDARVIGRRVLLNP